MQVPWKWWDTRLAGDQRAASQIICEQPRDAEAQEQPHLRLQIPRLASQYTTVTCCRIRQQRVNYNLRAHPRLSAESPACGLAVGQGTK
jgi:hypothetical protein